MENCKIHILNTDKSTSRIGESTSCEVCDEYILGENIKWITWNIDEDCDPDNMFIDVRSKYYAFLRVKEYKDIHLSFSKVQKLFVKKITPKMRYWMENPLKCSDSSEDAESIYCPVHYRPKSYFTFLDNLINLK